MNLLSLLRIAACCAAGLLAGIGAKHLAVGSHRGVSPDPTSSANGGLASRENSGDPASVAAHVPKPGGGPHSADTLETVLSLDAKNNYGRLALWMIDASEADIAAYWQRFRQQKNPDNDIVDLIFINWTRLDPRAAIAAATGTDNEQHAWWAWACHAPQAALAAAIAGKPNRVKNVAWSIGEFHPDWLRAHFDEIPLDARKMAITGLTKRGDGGDPLATLNFLEQHHAGLDDELFKSLVIKDPYAAYDWIRKDREVSNDPFDFDPKTDFVKTLNETHPEVLEQLAKQAPSGALKRQMEAALFENLLRSDPEAAIEQAKTTEAPIVAAQRLAAAGLSLIRSDPDRAFALAENLFSPSKNPLLADIKVECPGGDSTTWSKDPQVSQFMNGLIVEDPARVMSMAVANLTEGGPYGGFYQFNTLAQNWAQRDVLGYAEWVNQQSDPAVYDKAAGNVVSELKELGNYVDAAEWALTLDQSRADQLVNLLESWQSQDPAEVQRWLESANLPESEKQQLKANFKKP